MAEEENLTIESNDFDAGAYHDVPLPDLLEALREKRDRLQAVQQAYAAASATAVAVTTDLSGDVADEVAEEEVEEVVELVEEAVIEEVSVCTADLGPADDLSYE